MAHDVFISYSSKDKTTADALCVTLESQGIRCWIAPRDVTPSREWGECIIDALEEARIMVLIFTADADASPQIHREVERAVNRGIAILPFRIENVIPGRALEYFIGNVHWLDALTPPMEEHLKSLAETIKVLLARMGPRAGAGSAVAGGESAETETDVPATPAGVAATPSLTQAYTGAAAQGFRAQGAGGSGPVAGVGPSGGMGTLGAGQWQAGGATAARPGRKKIPMWAWGAGAIAVLLVGGLLFMMSHKAPPAQTAPGASGVLTPVQPQNGPAPPGDNATLAVTMKYIQDELNANGKVTFVEHTRNTKNSDSFYNKITNEITNVTADAGTCDISLHFTEIKNDAAKPTVDDPNSGVDLVSVRSVVVEPEQQDETEVNAAAGYPYLIVYAVDPAVSAVLVHWRDQLSMFPFYDANAANNVAAALNHAAKLCGGEK